MLVKRRDGLIQYLKNNKTASLDELCEKFQVSKSTIRRDIDEIEAQNLIKKVYGGVVLVEDEKALPVNIRNSMHINEKDSIGRAAASLVNDGDSILVDGGTTALQMIKYLKDKKNVTVVTNSILVVNDAILYKNLNIIVTGGNLLLGTNSLIGAEAINIMKNLTCRYAFISATGLSIEKGLSNAFLLEAEVKREMIKCGHKFILMVDHSKFDMISMVTFADLKDVEILITDATPDEKYLLFFEKNNIKLIIAE